MNKKSGFDAPTIGERVPDGWVLKKLPNGTITFVTPPKKKTTKKSSAK